jgi:transposase
VGIRSITALTHPQIFRLIKNKVIELGLFDERDIAEIYDPDTPDIRYLLCRNPISGEKERRTRQELIKKTKEALEKLERSRKKRSVEQLSAEVGKTLARWKVGKFFKWEIVEKKLKWEIDHKRIESEEALDGCYVIRTDVSKKVLDKDKTVECYRQLAEVERGFRRLKTVGLEIRPTYHHLDRRIESHVFLCVLAYYVEWHMRKLLSPLFENDGKGKDRRWTFEGVLERLKSIREEVIEVQKTEVTLKTRIDYEHQQILELLDVDI